MVPEHLQPTQLPFHTESRNWKSDPPKQFLFPHPDPGIWSKESLGGPCNIWAKSDVLFLHIVEDGGWSSPSGWKMAPNRCLQPPKHSPHSFQSIRASRGDIGKGATTFWTDRKGSVGSAQVRFHFGDSACIRPTPPMPTPNLPSGPLRPRLHPPYTPPQLL